MDTGAGSNRIKGLETGTESQIPGVADNYKWRAMATVAVGTLMGPLDGTVVNIALPTLANYFRAPVTTVEWVVTAYLLVISSLLLTYGRLGDTYGHKPVYMAGFGVFSLGSLLSALSPTIGFLVAARVVQAIGAGMMMAIGPAIITSAFPASERGKALGINGMTVAVGTAVGPVLGGLLVHLFGWQSIFYINIPIGLFGIGWAWRVLRWEKPAGRQQFDINGSFLLFGMIFSLLLVLSQGRAWGWGSLAVVLLLLGCAICAVLFVIVELRHPNPMMDLRLFSNRLFTMASISALLNFMSQNVMIFLMPFYLQGVRALDPSRAGLLMIASPVVIFIVAPLAGSLSDRIGSRPLSTAGMVTVTTGLVLLSRLGPATPYWQVVLPLMVVGLGMALFQSPNSSAIMGSVPRNRLGIGSGMMATMRNVGMVTGTAISAAIYDSRLPFYTSQLGARGYSGAELKTLAFTSSLHDTYLLGGVLAAIGIITSLARPGAEKSKARSNTAGTASRV